MLFKRIFLVLLLSSFLTPEKSLAQQAISGVINKYYRVIETAKKCQQFIIIDSLIQLKPHQLILIHQTQGSIVDSSNSSSSGRIISLNNTGKWEFNRVMSQNKDTVFLARPLKNTYMAFHTQLITVPEYNTVQTQGPIKAKPWDGATGGIIAIVADTLIISDTISARGLGFRGGKAFLGPETINDSTYLAECNSTHANAMKGEGVAGGYSRLCGRGAWGNGGGGGNSHTGGGAGGSCVSRGGMGGWGDPSYNGIIGDPEAHKRSAGIGGYSLLAEDDLLFMGGGGGAGSDHALTAGDGGNGGGILVLITNVIIATDTGIIDASGADGVPPNTSDPFHQDGGGGGGAGGTILLQTRHITGVIKLISKGGNGTHTSRQGAGPGGGGSGGWIKLSLQTVPNSSLLINVEGGTGGLANGTSWGATDGEDGHIDTLQQPILLPDSQFMPLPQITYHWIGKRQVKITINNVDSCLWFDGIKECSRSLTYPASGFIHDSILIWRGDCFSIKTITLTMPMPNLLTPNGDGINDNLLINAPENGFISLKVFNKWGKVVYKCERQKQCIWKGTCSSRTCPNDTYFYVLTIDYSDGEFYKQSGHITVITD